MDKNDIVKLFKLLGCYFPNAKQLNDGDLKWAWVLALAPYSYEDARAAAVEHARRQNFFPDVADLVKLIGAVKDERKKTAEGETWRFRDPQHAAACRALGLETWEEAETAGCTLEDWLARYAEVRKQLPPTFGSLKRQGMTYAEQTATVEAAWAEFWAKHPEEAPA